MYLPSAIDDSPAPSAFPCSLQDTPSMMAARVAGSSCLDLGKIMIWIPLEIAGWT